MFLSDRLVVERVDAKRWMVSESLAYYGSRDIFTVPAGYVTDFASVPRFLQWFAPSTGDYTLAAVLHDYLCDGMGAGRTWYQSKDCPPGYAWDQYVTSRDVDGLFRRVMREQGVPLVLRWLMWTGVRWGAVFNRRRRPGVLRDMPLVLPLSVLALPLILPASVCIGVAFVLMYVFEGLAGWFVPTYNGK